MASAAALSRRSSGRFTLGIGSGNIDNAAYRRRWGIAERSPLALVRAYLTTIRRFLAGEPVKCGVPLADFASGLYAAFAIASALTRVRAGGAGTHIDVPMYGCTLGIAALQTSEYFGNGKSPVKLGSAHPRNAPYQAYRAADGHFAIAAGNHKLWLAVLEVVEMPELAQDPRFATTSDRAANQKELKALLEARFTGNGVAHWIAAFHAAGVPHARINDYAAALADPQVEHMAWVRPLTLPGGTRTRTFASPLRFDGMGLPIRHDPPALGEHSADVRARYQKSDIIPISPTEPS